MTAHAVGSLSAASTPAKSASHAAAQDPAVAPFEHQLHAARQRGGQAAPEQRSAHAARPERDSDPGRHRQGDTSPPVSPARQAGSDTGRLDNSRDSTSGKNDAVSTAAAEPQATAQVPVPPVTTPATLPVVEMVAGAKSDEAPPVAPDADDKQQDAVALVGAMLALISPAASKVLTPGGTHLSAPAAVPVATDAGAGVLLQAGDVATMAVTTNVAAVPAQLLAVNGLSLDPKNAHDSARADAAPALALPASAPAAPAAPLSAPLPASAGGHAFAQELGQQIAWFVGRDVKQARIRLHPEELGALDLKISMNHGRVDVVFHAQHPGAVIALQQSLPQLDQMLAQHGLSLGNTEVGQHDRGDRRGQAEHTGGVADAAEAHPVSLVTPLGQVGMLDAFA